ncbi:uncharacterized protein CCOS01_16619 [Colletotrichum costaricense]|uniref:Uncharacterized protein n=2 Tax=Colletotrichum acutatum species complex TaxID=2707335 RepID=A0AAJ0DSC1_9PEZI|nr:uncharacterized protein CCOS01_16619 [Colletotrichum costaricense]XP_060383552.1 uncharacterized protein CTAM01_05853 [Colletotrichum tamarilloi]KAI3537767.1 hypothetical protein CSPX01_09937 [Colletotrichum filicis]KAK1501629.1 hypothetical protein CTAM01_05853 [Colletotrichum tamarilloi]KAK1505929.1 hypothetical protein CCOS01_16619 [Colletotrichum costaricense]
MNLPSSTNSRPICSLLKTGRAMPSPKHGGCDKSHCAANWQVPDAQ